MMRVTRSVLAKAFPNNPRLISEIEKLDAFLNATSDKTQSAREQLDSLLSDLGDGGKYQRASDILAAIADLPDKVGTIEVTADGQAVVRPIDSQDPASLVTRGAGYTVFVGIGGKGTTAQRPTLPATTVAIYFDTTLAAAGQPIFWTGAGWVDSSGTAV
jgi:hypothetical protein